MTKISTVSGLRGVRERIAEALWWRKELALALGHAADYEGDLPGDSRIAALNKELIAALSLPPSPQAPTEARTPVDEPKNDDRAYGCYTCGKQGLKKGQRVSLVYCNECDAKHIEEVRRAAAPSAGSGQEGLREARLQALEEARQVAITEREAWKKLDRFLAADAADNCEIGIRALIRETEAALLPPASKPPATVSAMVAQRCREVAAKIIAEDLTLYRATEAIMDLLAVELRCASLERESK